MHNIHFDLGQAQDVLVIALLRKPKPIGGKELPADYVRIEQITPKRDRSKLTVEFIKEVRKAMLNEAPSGPGETFRKSSKSLAAQFKQ